MIFQECSIIKRHIRSLNRLNILFVTPVNLGYPGGAERWLCEVGMRLSKRGHKIGILYTSWAPKKTLVTDIISLLHRSRSIRLYKCGFVKPPLRGMALVDIFSIRRVLNDYDLSYIFAYPPNELQIRFFKRLIQKTLIAGIHTFLNLESDIIHRLYLPLYLSGMKAFKAIHVLNKFTLNFFKQNGFRNVYLIPNGVDTQEYKLCYPPWGSDTFTILFSGRLTYDKGADILIDIIKCTRTFLNEKVKFVITGTGPLRKVVERTAKEFSNVKYLGYVDRAVLKQVYRRAHLFLAPSRSEGMPLRVLEAQSGGLPVIGSKIPGIFDVVINGETGCLINVGDVKGFAGAVKKYYELWRRSPEEYYKTNKAIRRYIVKNYDWQTVIERLEAMFRLVIDESHRSGNLC